MSTYGFCHLSVIPVRENPSDKSQMTTQLLFGDVFEQIDSQANWLFIRNAYDSYTGWIDNKQQIPIDSEQFKQLKKPQYINEHLGTLLTNQYTNHLPPSCSFPSLTSFVIEECNFEPKLALVPFSEKPVSEIIPAALVYLNAPYLWGGKSIYGIDCSGFTQSVYKIAGRKLLRDAAEQETQGETLSFLGETVPGDLAFFDNEDGKIIHVGIILAQDKIIHASGKVRIDTIDHQGIFNEDVKKYTHKLRLLKTFKSSYP